MRFSNVEKEPDGTVTGVVIEHLDKNGNVTGRESVPPLMFIQNYKKSNDLNLNTTNSEPDTHNIGTEQDRNDYVQSKTISAPEINDSPFEQIIKDGAIAYINGNVNFATSIAYQQIYNYVRNRPENNQSDSTTENSAQPASFVDEATGRESRPDGVQTVGMAGGNDNSGSGQNSKELNLFPDGERSDTGIRREESGNDGLSAGDTGRKGSGRTGSNGHNVRKRGGERVSKSAVKSNPKRGGKSTDTERNGIINEINSLLDEFVKAGNESASISVIGMNSRQIEIAGKILVAGVRLGYTYIKDGITKFTEWRSAMREKLAIPFSSSMNLTDSEIDEFISDMWEYPHTVDGETRPLKEWASIMDKKQLMDSVKSTLNDKKKLQEEAESVPVKIADRSNISETLPFLLPQQQDDVFKAEIQFFDESHNDRDHAFGKGYMFTNGTGTGKTYTGLGIVKRFIKQGKGRILILTPSQTKVSDWIKDAANLGIELNDLDAVSKTKKDGTTATTEKGEGAVITTYANFRQNKALLEDLFDLVVYDESHRLLENKGGTGTTGSIQHYKISNRNEQFAFLRLQEINSVWNELQSKYEKFNSERDDVIERIKKENGIKNELTLGQRVELPPIFNGNWTENAERKFPKLSKLRKEISLLNAKFENETKPELERKAKENVKHTKVVFLSATPFNTRENLDYAEGYIFSYPEREKQDGYSIQSPRSQFYLEHFGAGYRWRYHRLENSGINPEAVSKQEVEFSDYLQHTLQTMSGRIIDSPFDYSRDFPTVTLDKAEEFNSAMEELSRDETTRSAYYEVMGDYNYTSALFESMKVAQIIPRLKEHLAHGRKAVIFHRRVESKNPILPPFKAIFDRSVKALETEYDAAKKDKKKRKIAALRSKYAGMLEWERKLDLRMPREQLADAFGKGNVLFFSGKESKGMKDKAVNDFNNDESGKSIIVIQEASGKEGISLHDTTGKHQRVLVTLALPQSPITALQIEGRIYRIGNKSNAIFEYPLLGLNAELMLFGQKFNQQVSTTENLALGSQARNLRESFARGVEEHSGDVDIDGQGIGGKEYDASNLIETDAFGSAVLDYYTNMKLTGRRDNREGIDYYPTPEPLGFMMSRWGRISEGESVLEPSAGHGAIARYVPRENQLTAIEPSQRLFSKLQIKAGGNGRTFENTIFEAYNIVNKHDVVLMNPPFGTGGKLAVDHVAKAFQHLDEGGRIVTIIPRGTADKKFDKWYMEQKNAVMSAEINLPDITFERAGTSVNCRVVVIDKVTNETLRNDASSRAEHIDLSGKRYDKIEEFFEDIRNIDVPERTIDTKAKLKRKSATTARELKAMKDIKYVSLDENRIYVSGNGVSAEIEWGDRKDDVLTSYLSYQYRRFKGNYDYAAQHGRETQEAAYGEMKNLACKLAGMTEDEMQRYIDKNNENVRYREEDSVQRSIIDRETNELAKEYLNEDLTRYPYEDRRTDKNKEGEVYYGYSEPLFKGENLMDSEFVPEVIKDIVRNDEYEIEPGNITKTLQEYIESEGGPEEEFARPFVDAFEWFNENRKDIRMSDKVNLIIDRNDSRMRDGSGMNNASSDSTEDMKREVEKTAYKLNVPVEVITSTDRIKDESVRKAIESGRKIKGWYSLSDRKVYVYLPNTSSVEDARQTILHEGVAHFGLRKLVGDENMDSFLDEIFANVKKEVREEIISNLPRYGWDSRVATEEYLASMAEQGADVSVWQRIIQAFRNLLRKIGIRMEINDKELRYILWRSRQNLESGNIFDMARNTAMQYEMGVGNYYREVEQTPEHSTVDAWDKIASSTMFSLRESAVDYLTAVDKFQELISKRSGEEIKPFENAYDSMTFLSSKNRVEMDWFDSNIVTPMRKAILALVGKQKGRKWDWEKGELRKLVMYVEAKHGTERNRQMAVEKFIKEFRPESLKFFEKAGISIDRKKYEEELDSIKEKARKKAYEKSFRKIYDNLVKEGTQKEEAEKEAKKRADAIALIAESNASEKFWNDSRDKLMKEYTEKFMSEWNDIKKRISEKKDMSWIEKQKELDKEASRLGADLTQDYSGLSSVFGDENTYPKGWYEESMNFVDEYEKSHEKKDIDGLWKSISDATGYTLNKQYESGLVSKEYVETQKKRFENYIPLRGFQDEIAGDVYNYIGNDFYPGSNPVKSAGGRTSEPGNPFGSILNTGYSTISVGNKNLAKMSFFSLVNNHDTEGLAVAGRAWAVKYDRLLEDEELREVLVMPDLKKDEEIPEWVEAVPKYPDNSGYNTNDGSKSRTSPVTDMSSEDVARLLGKFEEVMKKNSKEGYAKPISKKSKIAYRTLYNERSEHEIPLFILGDKYVITITGNPRVAQAMNGLLNPNVNNKGWSEFGEKVQRFMAGAMTAKNAAFSIGNISKDSIYANNQVFIKENTSYWLRFTKNQKGGFGDFIPMMIRLKNYRDGKLDMSDKSDVMFKEFMDNGGATGYTFVDTQEKYAKELADKLKELSRKTPGMIDPRKITKAFFDSVEFTGQAAELVNRFAAYRTSREMGRSVNRSIRDAKEITVNFNRKGAGMKSWNDNKSVFNPLNTAAFLSQYGRSYILFWNANMQAKYRFYRNIKEHPIKTTTTLIGNSMLFASVLIPFMNNFALPALYEMFGCGSEDDDEDYYNVLTDFERTRNICVRLPHGNWLKIPLSPDMSPWFTMGDCIGGAITGQRELSASDFIKSGIDAISPLSINWSYEGPNIVLNVLPTIFQPGAQIAMNVNFMGNPIRKQPFTMRQGFAPKYTMVYGNTSPTLIELSRLSNRLTGGNDRKTSGSLDWNPADIQNLITGYTGGYGSSFLSAADWIVSTLKGEEQSTTVGKMPLVSRFFISGNKDVKVRRVNSSFYDVIRFTEEFKFDRKSLEDEIQNSLKEGNKEKAMQSRKDLEELLNSDRAKKFIELESIVEAAKDFDRYMKEIPEDENTKGIIYEIKMKGIERLKQK